MWSAEFFFNLVCSEKDFDFKEDKISDYQDDTDEVSAKKTPAGCESTSYNARQLDLRQAYDRYEAAINSEERFAAGEELQAILVGIFAVVHVSELIRCSSRHVHMSLCVIRTASITAIYYLGALYLLVLVIVFVVLRGSTLNYSKS